MAVVAVAGIAAEGQKYDEVCVCACDDGQVCGDEVHVCSLCVFVRCVVWCVKKTPPGGGAWAGAGAGVGAGAGAGVRVGGLGDGCMMLMCVMLHLLHSPCGTDTCGLQVGGLWH